MSIKVHEKEIKRRSFLKMLGWGSLFLTLGISIVGSVRFLFPRVLFEKPSRFKIGIPDVLGTEQTVGKVYENWKAEHSVWIVKEERKIYAIHAKCTHLGCTPNYFADDGIFKCPCHGSQFHSSGVNFAGPAPRPLDRLHIAYSKDGQIVIDKRRVYTYREFDKEGAYVEV
jgi:cytochrome b6-f complex iron-sulfur subunit